MNSKFLRVIAGSIVTSMIVGGSLSTLYFINSTKTSTVDNNDFEDDGEESTRTEQQIAFDNAKAKLAENLSSSNLKFKNLVLKVDGLGNKNNNQLVMNFDGAADYKAFIDTRKDNDSSNDVVAKLTGKVNLKYNETLTENSVNTILDESLTLNSNGNGKLYLGLNWADNINGEEERVTTYSVSGKFLNDVLNFIPTLETLLNYDLSAVNDVVDQIKGIDILPMIPVICNALMSFSQDTDENQTPVEDGNGNKIYTYNLVVKENLLSSVGIAQDIKITLKANQNGLLTYIGLDPLTFNGITVSLSSDAEMSLDTTYVENDNMSGDYNNLDCTTNLLTTVTSLVDEKVFDTKFNLSFKEDVNGVTNANRQITGSLKGNLKNATSINNGAIYDIQLGGEKDLYSKVNVRYADNKTYFNVHNQLATGYIEDSTIDDLVKNIVGTVDNNNQESTNESLDSINNILKDKAIYDIINGNWNAYKKIIKNLTVDGDPESDCYMNLEISAKGLYSKLLDKSFTIQLDLSNGKLNSLNIIDLPINESTDTEGKTHVNYVSFSLSLNDYTETDIETVYGDLTTYTNFKIVSPIYNTISKVVNDKQLAATYSFDYTKANETTSLVSATGNINADLNNIDSMDFGDNVTFDSAIDVIKGKNLGQYQLGISANVNGVPHNATLTYQNQGLYLDYYGYSEASRTRMSLTQGKIFDIVDFATSLTNSSDSSSTTTNPFGDINSTLGEILNLTDGKIWTILNSQYLDELKDYVTIKNGSSEDSVVVTINTSLFNKDTTGSISVVLDTTTSNDTSLLAISASYVDSNNGIFNFSMNFKDSYDFTIPEAEITSYYKEMDTTVDSVLNIIKGVSTSFKVSGDLVSPRQ